jgi:hypothetical protein
MTTYLDGEQLCIEENLDPRDLTLGPRITILGGGKAAQARGGSVRRVILQDVCLTAKQARSTYLECARDHPAMGGKLVSIQVPSPPSPRERERYRERESESARERSRERE